jgi:hypothetical protein
MAGWLFFGSLSAGKRSVDGIICDGQDFKGVQPSLYTHQKASKTAGRVVVQIGLLVWYAPGVTFTFAD